MCTRASVYHARLQDVFNDRDGVKRRLRAQTAEINQRKATERAALPPKAKRASRKGNTKKAKNARPLEPDEPSDDHEDADEVVIMEPPSTPAAKATRKRTRESESGKRYRCKVVSAHGYHALDTSTHAKRRHADPNLPSTSRE